MANQGNLAEDATALAQTSFYVPAGNNKQQNQNLQATQKSEADRFDETRDDLEFSNTFSDSNASVQINTNKFSNIHVQNPEPATKAKTVPYNDPDGIYK